MILPDVSICWMLCVTMMVTCLLAMRLDRHLVWKGRRGKVNHWCHASPGPPAMVPRQPDDSTWPECSVLWREFSQTSGLFWLQTNKQKVEVRGGDWRYWGIDRC